MPNKKGFPVLNFRLTDFHNLLFLPTGIKLLVNGQSVHSYSPKFQVIHITTITSLFTSTNVVMETSSVLELSYEALSTMSIVTPSEHANAAESRF